MEVVDDERQKSAAERQRLLTQITSLITANAETQEKRLSDRVASVSEDISAAVTAYDTKQAVYNEGVSAWSNKSNDILAGVSKSRDAVKSKIKADFAVCFFHHFS